MVVRVFQRQAHAFGCIHLYIILLHGLTHVSISERSPVLEYWRMDINDNKNIIHIFLISLFTQDRTQMLRSLTRTLHKQKHIN